MLDIYRRGAGIHVLLLFGCVADDEFGKKTLESAHTKLTKIFLVHVPDD